MSAPRREVIGDAELWLGDCREVLPTLSGAALCLTDPPYGVTYQSNHRVGQGSKPISNDGTRASLRLSRAVIRLLRGLPILWFTRWDAWPDIWEIMAAHMPVNGTLIWDKGHNGMGNLEHWGCTHELIVSAGPVRCRGGRDGSILRYTPVPPNKRLHPTEKPVDLLAYLIEKTTDPGDLVLDPFMGSAAVGAAARATGRRFVGIEDDPEHYEAAVQRLGKLNGSDWRDAPLFTLGDAA